MKARSASKLGWQLTAGTAVIAASTLVLTACSGSSSGTDATSASASTPAEASSPAASASASAAPSGPATGEPIKIGVLTDTTGPYAIVGKSNVAAAQFTIDEINANGGVLGRPLEMVLADGGSDAAINAQAATKLVEQDDVSMVIGGVASFEREAVKDIIAGRGDTIYVWPASYEGGECTPNIWSVGSVPNQQVDPVVDKLLAEGKKTFFLTGNDYIYPRNILDSVKKKVEAGGGTIVGEEYVPLDLTDPSNLVSKVLAADPDVLFEVVILPATVPFIQGVVDGGFTGTIAGTLFDESINPLIGKQADGLINAQDYFWGIEDEFSKQQLDKFNTQFPDAAGLFTPTLNAPAWYRGLYLWKDAVERAGTLDTAAVDAAMDTASVEMAIGGPASVEPGTRHVNLPMFIGESQADGSVVVLNELGQIKPEQCQS